jgi:hypothetical protein
MVASASVNRFDQRAIKRIVSLYLASCFVVVMTLRLLVDLLARGSMLTIGRGLIIAQCQPELSARDRSSMG